MAELRIIEENEFRVSRFAQLADQVDGDLSEIIAQAEQHIERKLGRRFDEQGYIDIVYVSPNNIKVFLEERPVTGVTAVARRSWHGALWEELNPDDFRIYTTEGYLSADGADVGGYEVRVTYTAGYTQEEMPADLKAAVLIQTALLIYQDLEIYGIGDGRPPGILYLQENVRDLIKPYKRLVL